MKLENLERVNHLVGDLSEVDSLIRTAEDSEPAMYQLIIEAPGDGSMKMSSEGSSTTHARGIAVTPAFLERLKALAVAELRARRDAVLAELTALGVDTAAGT